MDALPPRPVWSVCYWTLVALMFVVGVGGAFTIGIPFLIMGAVLVVLSPFRRRPAVFWPPIIALLTFMGGMTLFSPVKCSTSEASEATVMAPSQAAPVTPASPATPVTSRTGEGSVRTSCTNLVGIDYSGPGHDRPTLPILLVVLLAATLLGLVSRSRLRRRESPAP